MFRASLLGLSALVWAACGCAGKGGDVASSVPSGWTAAPVVTAFDPIVGKQSIRVLALFTAEAVVDDLDYVNKITAAVEANNEGLERSGVSHRLVLTDTVVLPSIHGGTAEEPTGLSTSGWLAWLSTQLRDHSSAVALAREASTADVVVLVGAPELGASQQTGGVSFDEPAAPAAAVAFTEDLDLQIGHAVGHLLGAGHGLEEDERTGFAHGNWTGDVACAMSRVSDCNRTVDDVDKRTGYIYGTETIVCSNQLVYSNPHLLLDGAAFGDRTTKYNACTIERSGAYVSRFYEMAYGVSAWAPVDLKQLCK